MSKDKEEKPEKGEPTELKTDMLYVECKEPETGEDMVLELPGHIPTVLDALKISCNKYEGFIDQEIRVVGYNEIDFDGKPMLHPSEIFKGRVREGMEVLASQCLSNEHVIHQMIMSLRALARISNLKMVTFDYILDNEGNSLTGGSTLVLDKENATKGEFLMLHSAMLGHAESFKEEAMNVGVIFEDDTGGIIVPGGPGYIKPAGSKR